MTTEQLTELVKVQDVFITSLLLMIETDYCNDRERDTITYFKKKIDKLRKSQIHLNNHDPHPEHIMD